MKKIINLFLYEIKNIYKQLILFALLTSFLLTLSLGLLCFANDMRSSYCQFMDQSCESPLSIYVDGIGYEDMLELNSSVDYIWYATSLAYGTIGFEDNEISSENPPEGFAYLIGQGCYFKDALSLKTDSIDIMEGSVWTNFDNFKSDNNNYKIYLADIVSTPLGIHCGDIISWEYNNYVTSLEVAAIYDINSYSLCYVVPLNLLYEINDTYSVRLEINRPSDSISVCTKLKSMDLIFYSYDWSLESNTAILSMEIILYIISILLCVVTCFILSNILTITLKTRKKFIAKLKLLGFTDAKICGIYYMWLTIAYLVSFAIGIILTNSLCSSFSIMGELILLYPVVINLSWVAVILIGSLSVLVLGLRFLFFKRSISKITPIELVKEE